MSVTFKIVDVSSPLIAQYLAIRAEQFSRHYEQTKYPPELNQFDKRTGALFLLSEENGQITGGLRFLIRKDLNGAPLPFEGNNEGLDAVKILPHIDLSRLTYCEIGSLAAKDNCPNTGRALIEEAIRMGHAREVAADIFVTINTERSITLIARKTADTVSNSVIRADLKLTYQGDGKFYDDVCR